MKGLASCRGKTTFTLMRGRRLLQHNFTQNRSANLTLRAFFFSFSKKGGKKNNERWRRFLCHRPRCSCSERFNRQYSSGRSTMELQTCDRLNTAASTQLAASLSGILNNDLENILPASLFLFSFDLLLARNFVCSDLREISFQKSCMKLNQVSRGSYPGAGSFWAFVSFWQLSSIRSP